MNWQDYLTAEERDEYDGFGRKINAAYGRRKTLYNRCRKRMERDKAKELSK